MCYTHPDRSVRGTRFQLAYCIIYSYEIHITTTTTKKVAHPTAIRDTTIHYTNPIN